jgi:DNA mismatch endonuclease (patch repair protein)
MEAQRRRDTGPEKLLRSELHRLGLRFRLSYPVPGAPRRTIDVAFTRVKVAVFVDGCFWHACPDHATWPKNNETWWRAKLEANRIRDRDTDARLAAAGWLVLRFWEHEDAQRAAGQVEAAVRRRACQ